MQLQRWGKAVAVSRWGRVRVLQEGLKSALQLFPGHTFF